MRHTYIYYSIIHLTRWPSELSSTQQMNVQVVYGLLGVESLVDHETITVQQIELLGHFTRSQQQLAQLVGITWLSIVHLTHCELLGNDEQVGWRVWTDYGFGFCGNSNSNKKFLIRNEKVSQSKCYKHER